MGKAPRILQGSNRTEGGETPGVILRPPHIPCAVTCIHLYSHTNRTHTCMYLSPTKTPVVSNLLGGILHLGLDTVFLTAVAFQA